MIYESLSNVFLKILFFLSESSSETVGEFQYQMNKSMADYQGSLRVRLAAPSCPHPVYVLPLPAPPC